MTTPLQDLGFGLTASDFTTPVTEITSAFKIEKAIFERRWKDIATAIKTKNNRDFTVRAIISQDDPEMLEFLFGHTEVSWEDMEGYIRGSKELSLASLRSLLQKSLDGKMSGVSKEDEDGLESREENLKESLEEIERELTQHKYSDEYTVTNNLIELNEVKKEIEERLYPKNSLTNLSIQTTESWQHIDMELASFLETVLTHTPLMAPSFFAVTKEYYPHVVEGIKKDVSLVLKFLYDTTHSGDTAQMLAIKAEIFQDADWELVFKKFLTCSLSEYNAGNLDPDNITMILSNKKIKEGYEKYQKSAQNQNKEYERLIKEIFPLSEYTEKTLAEALRKNADKEIKKWYKKTSSFDNICAFQAEEIFADARAVSVLSSTEDAQNQIITQEKLLSTSLSKILVPRSFLFSVSLPEKQHETLSHFFASSKNRVKQILLDGGNKKAIDFCLSQENTEMTTKVFAHLNMPEFISIAARPEIGAWRNMSGETAGAVFIRSNAVYGLTPLLALYKAQPSWFLDDVIVQEFKKNGMSKTSLAQFEKTTMRRALRQNESVNTVLNKKSKKSRRLL